MSAKVTVQSRQQIAEDLIIKDNLIINGKAGLEAENVPGLRKYIRQLGFNNIIRDGEEITVNKARKEELLTAIRNAIAPTELIAEVFPEASGLEIEVLAELNAEVADETSKQLAIIADSVYQAYYKKVESITGKDGLFDATDSLKIVAYILKEKLDGYITVDGEGLQPNTKISYRGKILKSLSEKIEKEPNELSRTQLNKYFEGFKKACFQVMTDDSKEKAKNEIQALAHREITQIRVDISNTLLWAKDTLENVNAKSKWVDVSVALALVTGRRQDEIHGKGKFELIDEYTLSFSGQSKATGEAKDYFEENPSYPIPTLINAEIVMKGWNWLVQADKTGKENKIINDNMNGYLGDKTKDVALTKISFYRYFKDEVIHPHNNRFYSAKEKKAMLAKGEWNDNCIVFTYHKLREIYAVAAYTHFGVKAEYTSQKHYAALILGHDRTFKEGLGKSQTAMRYEADFELYPNSLVVI